MRPHPPRLSGEEHRLGRCEPEQDAGEGGDSWAHRRPTQAGGAQAEHVDGSVSPADGEHGARERNDGDQPGERAEGRQEVDNTERHVQ